MGDLEARLQRLRIEVRSLVMAFSEPSSSLKIAKEYKEMFDSHINFKQFGYSCLESLLKDCSNLEFINAGGKVLFKAKITEETESLQKMISAQKKKKKKTKPTRPTFQRASQAYRSYAKSSKKVNQFDFSRSSYRAQNAFQRRSRTPVRVPQASIKPDGVIGKQRFARIMKSYDGKVTLKKFCDTYMSFYGVPLDKTEMEALFGIPSLLNVHAKYLCNDIDIILLPKGYLLISKENIQKQKIWGETHTFEIVPKTIKWDKPSLATLYKNVVHLLKEMYPETIHLTEASEIYKRFYSVQVDPLALYAKTWEQLTTGVFKEKLRLIDNLISLREEVILAEKLEAPPALSSQQSMCTSVSDIMIASSDEDGCEYQQGIESDVESVASYFTTSNPAEEKLSDTENDERDVGSGFGFGRVSSLRKSRKMNKKETNKVETVPHTSNSTHSQAPEIASLQVYDEAADEPKKGRGFGFKNFAKSLLSKLSDKEKEKEKEKDKTNLRKVSNSSMSGKQQFMSDETMSSDGSTHSHWNGFQVKYVGQKYNNSSVIAGMERALSHATRNPLNTSR